MIHAYPDIGGPILTNLGLCQSEVIGVSAKMVSVMAKANLVIMSEVLGALGEAGASLQVASTVQTFPGISSISM